MTMYEKQINLKIKKYNPGYYQVLRSNNFTVIQ